MKGPISSHTVDFISTLPTFGRDILNMFIVFYKHYFFSEICFCHLFHLVINKILVVSTENLAPPLGLLIKFRANETLFYPISMYLDSFTSEYTKHKYIRGKN